MLLFVLLCLTETAFGVDSKMTRQEVIQWVVGKELGIQDVHGRGRAYPEIWRTVFNTDRSEESKSGWGKVEGYLDALSAVECLQVAREVLNPKKENYVHLGFIENISSPYRKDPMNSGQYSELSKLLREYVDFHQKNPLRRWENWALYWHLCYITEVLHDDIVHHSLYLKAPIPANGSVLGERIFDSSKVSKDKPTYLSWEPSLMGDWIFSFERRGIALNADSEDWLKEEAGGQKTPSYHGSGFDEAFAQMRKLGKDNWGRDQYGQVVGDSEYLYQLWVPPPHDKSQSVTRFYRFDQRKAVFQKLTDTQKFPFLKFLVGYDMQLIRLGSGRLVVAVRERYHPHSVTRVYVANTTENLQFTERFTTDGTLLIGADEGDELWIFRPRADGRGEDSADTLTSSISDSMTIYHAREDRFELGFRRERDYIEPKNSDLLGPPLVQRWKIPESILTPSADKKVKWQLFQKGEDLFLLESSLRVGWDDRWRWFLHRLSKAGGDVQLVCEVVLEGVENMPDMESRLYAPDVFVMDSGLIFAGAYAVWRVRWNQVNK